MAFTPIDEQTWERREYLEVFRQTAIYLTAEVDITPLYRHTKARGEKLYPALIWCAAAVLNRHVHFRYGRDEAGRIGIGMCCTPITPCPGGTPRTYSP
ncbi:CatA-like O-acetyltransferase [Dysosmobacter welbionis]